MSRTFTAIPHKRQVEIDLSDRVGPLFRLSISTFGHVGEHKVTMLDRHKGGSLSLSVAFEAPFEARTKLLNAVRYGDVSESIRLCEEYTRPRLAANLVHLIIEEVDGGHSVTDEQAEGA